MQKLKIYLAVGVVNQLDRRLSWNLEHISKFKRKNEVNGINLLLGYKNSSTTSNLKRR
jgi:hypothetical protein